MCFCYTDVADGIFNVFVGENLNFVHLWTEQILTGDITKWQTNIITRLVVVTC